MITSSSLSYALDEVVSVVVYENLFDGTWLFPAFYNVRTSSLPRERSASFGGLTTWSVKTETSAPASDEYTQQFEKTFTHVARGKQIPVSREFVDDQQWGFMEDIGQQLAYTANLTMETQGMLILNNAFTGATAEGLSEDGLSLCNIAHLNSDSGNSQSNTGTNSLGMAGINTTRIAMRKFTNYRGDKLNIMPDELWLPVDLEETAWEIARSVGRPDTANRAENMYNGAFTLYVSPFITDTNAWFMCDSRLRKQNALWFQRVGVEVFGDGNLLSGTKTIGGYTRFINGPKDWRFIYGNNPS